MLARAAPSVVQVMAQGCGGTVAQRAGSGFVWESPDRVVTALHVVGGCGSITVNFQGIGERTATLERSLVARDLALLRVAAPPPVPALATSPAQPPANEIVWVYGYGGGRATREDRQLRVTDANRETPLLQHAVDGSVRGELQRLGSPLLDTEVLRVEGFLVPGDSGAPVLDRAGRVVAVGSGGLQRGTIGAGWAVRARYLAELAASAERAAGPGGGAAALFALVDSDFVAEMQCGAATFQRTRNLSLGELLATSDDPAGFLRIAATSGRPIDSFAGLRFDLWIESRSGISVALPVGLKPDPTRSYCRSLMGPDGEIELRLTGGPIENGRADPVRGLLQMEQLSQRFFEGWAREFQGRLVADPGFTDPVLRPVLQGVLRRAGFEGPGRPGQRSHYIYQAHLGLAEAYVGIATIFRGHVIGRVPPPAVLDPLAAAVFATHLSTLPR